MSELTENLSQEKNKEKRETILFIINPIAGSRSKKNIPALIHKIIDQERFNPIIRYTKRAGHACEYAEKALKKGVRYIVAAGGDGTVNEVARVVAGSKAALGILPLGSGNGLARQLDIPMRTDKAIALINKCKVVRVDYGKANDIPFFCTCGVGFDAKISHAFAVNGKRGFISYAKVAVKSLFSYKSKKYKLTIDGQKHKHRAFLVTIANAQQYGNNAYIAPQASMQDGILDISVIRPFPFFVMLRMAIRLFAKNIDNSKYVSSYKGKEILLKRKKKGPFHFDGEPIEMGKKITFKVMPLGLKVIVAKQSKLIKI